MRALFDICVGLFVKSSWFIYAWMIAGIYLVKADWAWDVCGGLMILAAVGFCKGIIDMRVDKESL